MSHRTTDKFVKVKRPGDQAPKNEIRIRATPRIGRYISYAATLLLQDKLPTILLKASGNAAKSACQIAEILRHKIKGLHQLNELKTVSVTDEYEPREAGLERVVVERKLAVLEIQLSTQNNAFDTKLPGYQAPLPESEVQEEGIDEILRKPSDRPPRENRGPREDRGERGGYRGERRGPREDRGPREERGERRGERGGYRGDRPQGGYRGGYRGDREGPRDYERDDRERTFRGRGRGGRGGFRRGGDRGGERGFRGGRRD